MSMSCFKELMQETNSGLLDLEVLLHGGERLRPFQSERILPTWKALQTRCDHQGD